MNGTPTVSDHRGGRVNPVNCVGSALRLREVMGHAQVLPYCACVQGGAHVQTTKPITPAEFEREAQFLGALAHPVRLWLLAFLAGGPRCGCEIEPLLDLDHSTVSRHLGTLKRAGVLDSYRDGVKVMYGIKDARVLDLLRDASDLVVRGARAALARLEARLEV